MTYADMNLLHLSKFAIHKDLTMPISRYDIT